MANDSYTQQALAADSSFRQRVKSNLASVAWEVLNEADTVPNHDVRAKYARLVISQLEMQSVAVAPWLVMRPNLFGFNTSYDFTMGSVVTAAGDPDIASQLHSDWDILSTLQ